MLQHQALLDELEAIDADLTQLHQREAAVAGADTAYAAVLREQQIAAIARGAATSPELAALGDSEAKLQAMRKEVGEAITAGQAAHALLTGIQQAATSNNTAVSGIKIGTGFGGGLLSDSGLGGLGGYLVGDVASAAVRDTLRNDLGAAQHALVRFQRECLDVSPTSGVPGVELTPLPGLGMLVAREIVWSNHDVVDDLHAEVSLIETHVAQSVMELRARDRQLESALADVATRRAAVLDPQRDRL